jgi:hypothetical protein
VEALLKTTLIAHRVAGTHWIEVGSGDAPGVSLARLACRARHHEWFAGRLWIQLAHAP